MLKRFSLLVRALILLVLTSTPVFGQTNFWEELFGPYGGRIYALAVNDSGFIFAGTFNGGVFRSTNNGNNWMQFNSGLTSNNIRAFAFGSDGIIYAGSFGGGVFSSSNDGNTWIARNGNLPNLGVQCIALNSNGHIFVGMPSYGAYRSTDNGASWIAINTGIVPSGQLNVQSIGVSPNGNVFAGTSSDGVYRSTNNGDTWVQRNSGLPPSSQPLSFLFNDSLNILVAGNMGVYRSTNNGNIWTSSLTNTSVNSIVRNQNGLSLAGAECGACSSGTGVFISTDNGFTWMRRNTGLTDTLVTALAIALDGYAFAGTQSQGAFRSVESTTSVEQIGPELPISFSLKQNYPNPFNPSTRIQFSLSRYAFVTLKVYDLLGQEVATLMTGETNPGSYEVPWDATGQASGVYFYRLQAAEFSDTKKLILLK